MSFQSGSVLFFRFGMAAKLGKRLAKMLDQANVAWCQSNGLTQRLNRLFHFAHSSSPDIKFRL